MDVVYVIYVVYAANVIYVMYVMYEEGNINHIRRINHINHINHINYIIHINHIRYIKNRICTRKSVRFGIWRGICYLCAKYARAARSGIFERVTIYIIFNQFNDCKS